MCIYAATAHRQEGEQFMLGHNMCNQHNTCLILSPWVVPSYPTSRKNFASNTTRVDQLAHRKPSSYGMVEAAHLKDAV
jgi:hypothetical protein